MHKMVAAAIKAADTPGLDMDAAEHPQARLQKAVECRRALLANGRLELTQLKKKCQHVQDNIAGLKEDIEMFDAYETLLVNREEHEVCGRVVSRGCP
jgi:hypothetical protein